MTVKNLGPSTIVEVFVFPLKGFSIVDVKSVRGPASAGTFRGCTLKESEGKKEAGCKTKLPPGKSAKITLETKQEGSGPVLAVVAIKDSNGNENQKNVPER